MPRILVTGSFDDIKSRHLRFLEEAARLGPVTVLLESDEAIAKRTGQPPKFPEAERLYFLKAVRHVSEVQLVGTNPDSLPERVSTPTVWAMPGDENNAARQALCKQRGIEAQVITEAQIAGFPNSTFTQPEATGRKRVIVTGCYDWFHSGHVRFCEEASQHGDLYVVVGHDANIRLLKGAGRPLFPQEERRYILSCIRFVKEALVSSGNGWLDAEPEMQIIQPDIYAVNEDGDVPEKREYCEKHGLQYLVLKRAPAPGLPKRSSTSLRGY